MLFGLLFKRGVLSFRQNKISFADGSKDLKYSKDLIIVFNNYHLIIDFYIIKSKGVNCKIPCLFNCSLGVLVLSM